MKIGHKHRGKSHTADTRKAHTGRVVMILGEGVRGTATGPTHQAYLLTAGTVAHSPTAVAKHRAASNRLSVASRPNIINWRLCHPCVVEKAGRCKSGVLRGSDASNGKTLPPTASLLGYPALSCLTPGRWVGANSPCTQRKR
jgi:hypothetical protein